MSSTESDPVPEITVVGPAYWADHVVELTQFLRAAARGTKRMIADPSGSSAGQLAVVVDPAYWSDQSGELADAMRRASSDLVGVPIRHDREDRLSSGAAATQDRLTLTVEEAATVLGISRALAYEAVQHGDIPSIRIGRRILVPRSRLMKLLDPPAEQAEDG